MRFANFASIRNIGIGALAVLATLPLLYAQRPQQSQRDERTQRVAPSPRGEPASRGVSVHAPEERHPAVVDRVNHGTIRHVDTHIVQRPIEVHRDIDVHQHIAAHHDVDVDIHRPQFWHDFVFGARFHGLRAGYVQLSVGGAPYYYDDGIYYQQVGNDYQAVYPPVGANVVELPNGAIEIVAGNLAYYYAGGAFYVQQAGGFVIAAPPMGVIVPELPPGTVQVSVNGGVAYQFNGIYYRPVFVNGVTQYMTFMP